MLIGLAGAAGSGKSKVCERLQSAHGFKVLSLAEPIKEFVGRAFGFSDYQLFGPSEARSEPHPTKRMPNGEPLTARIACQVVGTDIARKLDLNVWVDLAMATADWHLKRGISVCFSDVRYANEIAAIRAAGGRLIRRKSDRPITDMHPSEQELLSMPDSAFDSVIPRMDTLEQLHGIVDTLVAGWRSEAAE